MYRFMYGFKLIQKNLSSNGFVNEIQLNLNVHKGQHQSTSMIGSPINGNDKLWDK